MLDSTNSSLGHLHAGRPLELPDQPSYQVQISATPDAPAWDRFLAETPGGRHVQSSLWAQVKALLGWRVRRVVVTRGAHIVAGAQVLIRPFAATGAIGYVPYGPVLATDDPHVTSLVLHAMQQLARTHRIQYLVVQPPPTGAALAQQLPAWGFRPTSIELAPTATILLDLTKELDVLLAHMKKNTRQNIRRGQRSGITVREGTEQDLPRCYHLLTATSQRQHFATRSYAYEYYVQMWRIFHPHGYIKLFLAEYEGEAVSAKLVIPFGDVVLSWRRGWSGHYGSYKPNEALEWAVIQWAHGHGYRYGDLGGLSAQAAHALVHGEPLPDGMQQTATSFKLGFGGQVTRFPATYDYIYNPVLRWGHRMVFPKIAHLSVVKNLQTRLRTH